MTIWKKYEMINVKSDQPCITVRRSGFALSVSFMIEAKITIGDSVEIFTSEEKDMIGFKFFSEKALGRLTVTPDGGGKSRVIDATKTNGFVTCSYIKNDPNLSKLVSTKNAKFFVTYEDGLWVIKLTSQWKYDTQTRLPTVDDIGVYRYLLDDEVVYIGRGKIQQRLASPERNHWQFTKIEYTLMSEDAATQRESQLIRAHKDVNGRLPFYNRNTPGIK